MTDPDPHLPDHLRARLAEPRGVRRIDALLAADDAAAAVAALSPPELHHLVHEVGFNDATDLVALATPAQLQGCVDLDAWDGDVFVAEAMKPWLAAVAEHGYEKVGEFWAGLDTEIRALFLARHCRSIYDLTLGEEPWDDEEVGPIITVDRFFALQLRVEDDDTYRLIRNLIDELYKADAHLARNTIMVARSELGAEIEEDAARWRRGRLADLGYVDFEHALELFRPLPADQVVIGEDTRDSNLNSDQHGHLPVPAIEELVRRSFLARALARIGEPAETSRLEASLLLVINQVLAAARARPGQTEVVQRASAYAAGTLSLGLETVSRGDLARAEQALRTVAMTRLFRVGYTVTTTLQRMAKALLPRAQTAGEPGRDLCAALALPRPLMARAADRPPGAGLRPIESSEDLRRCAEVLTLLAARIALAEGLGVDLVAMATLPEPRAGLDDHLRTALARVLVGGEWSGQALTATEVAAIRADAVPGGAATAAARAIALATLRAQLIRAGVTLADGPLRTLTDGWLADLERLLGAVTDATVDARFVEGVLVEAGRG
jgi:hypothetical protein